MRTWRKVWWHPDMISGIRSDNKLFYVKLPMGRVELDTFLRDDCTCDVGEPRCDFHEKLFGNTGVEKEEETPV